MYMFISISTFKSPKFLQIYRSYLRFAQILIMSDIWIFKVRADLLSKNIRTCAAQRFRLSYYLIELKDCRAFYNKKAQL